MFPATIISTCHVASAAFVNIFLNHSFTAGPNSLFAGTVLPSSWAEVTALGYLKSIFPALIYGLTLIAGLSYFVVGLGKGSFGEYAPVVAMQIAYVVHSVGFPFLFDKWHAGTYLTLLAAVAYVVQIVSNHLGRRSVGE